MTLPDIVSDYLQKNFTSERRPFCFSVDCNYRLLGQWGDAVPHGFDGLRVGDAVDDRAPYLVGLLGDAAEQLPFVTTPSGTVEVHVLPDARDYYVIVMDAGREHAFHQDRQQVANEMRLLHASQQKLIDRQRSLITELVETKTELDHRRHEAEQANASKSRFIAMMSHEFRTPLASIINYADLAVEADTDIDTLRKSAEAIARASRHMNHLVETVLDEARLEAGHVKLNERVFSLFELCDDIAAIMAPLAAEKELSFGIFLDGGVPEYVVTDDVFLRQILINLLGNSVKFTESGGVRADLLWSRDELTVTVSDTGPGIAAADQQRIFEAFERAGDLGSDRRRGSGLGLTISLKLARLMGGDLRLSSNPGKGCSVELTVPADARRNDLDEVSALPEPAQEHAARRPATILVCDDDEDLLALADHYLQRAGYGLLVARDGEEAVEKALAFSPDLVLMDINIPRLSGSSAASRLRARGFEGPIVALTASDVRKLDGDDFTGSLRKPIQMPRLLAQIQAYI